MNYRRKGRHRSQMKIDSFVFDIMCGGRVGVCQKGLEDGLRTLLADFIL
jgi:hypothetical protein